MEARGLGAVERWGWGAVGAGMPPRLVGHEVCHRCMKQRTCQFQCTALLMPYCGKGVANNAVLHN